MDDNAPHDRRERAAKAAGKVLFVAALIAVAFLVPLPNLDIDLPVWLSPPDLPGWLRFLLGPGKLLVLAVIVLLVVLEQADRRRRDDRPGKEDDT
jgi:hypothetical protein